MGDVGRWFRPHGSGGSEPPSSHKAAGLIVNGLIALAFSLVMWYATESFLGWLALFLPGMALVIYGWYVALSY